MKKLKMVSTAIILSLFIISFNDGFADELKWEYSMDAAFLSAKTQNKKVLLFGGRSSCSNCRYMIIQVFESMKPPVKTLLEKNFVLWFCDIDESTEWHPYARGLSEIRLPLLCVIDPESENIYEERTTGRKDSPGFYSYILKYTKK